MLDLLAATTLTLAPVSLTLDTAAAVAQPAAQATAANPSSLTPAVSSSGVLEFGRRAPGTSISGPLRQPDWVSVTLGLAGDSDPGTHYQLAITPSWFLADRFEFGVELSGFYFDQPSAQVGATGDDATGGASFRLMGRWHFVGGSYSDAAPERLDWTIFADAGIGMVFSADDVPSGGTSVNFIPTAGVGATFRLDDSGTRLVIGARWHHISNARVNGDSDNPDFNAPMGYIGVQWAW